MVLHSYNSNITAGRYKRRLSKGESEMSIALTFGEKGATL
jgi:hypothetical protein